MLNITRLSKVPLQYCRLISMERMSSTLKWASGQQCDG